LKTKSEFENISLLFIGFQAKTIMSSPCCKCLGNPLHIWTVKLPGDAPAPDFEENALNVERKH